MSPAMGGGTSIDPEGVSLDNVDREDEDTE